METDAEKGILEYKKRIFLEFVDKSANLLKIPTPKVQFWSHYEDHFPDGERAHCHADEGLICISEPELKIMDEDEIKTTTSHEVTHILHPDHDYHFQNTQTDTEMGLWSPPSGTVGSLPEDYVAKVKKKDKRKKIIVKYKCNYHVCGKKAKTFRCDHCKHYFCKNHIDAKDLGNKFELDLDENNSHPCFRVSEYLEKEKQKEDVEYMKALNILLDKHIKITFPKKIKDDKEFQEVEEFFEEEFGVEEGIISDMFDEMDEQEEGEVEESALKFTKIFQKIKCNFGFHHWGKLGGAINVGGGEFKQRYVCERCRSTKEVIS